ncbi:ATP-binding cassette domain-containing protein [Corynebacterium sp.]|uniref:ATP-binding cassette domain-containing protein n=1 Tax=unclassified Corynebacterium TaxID=2624378 RepID=UPI0027BAA2AA|nr:ATP-binding cassette domain-containing protein [Corynebacterium sp.]
MIELHEITQTFGNFQALRGINLSVREGTVTCVLGDNGAGKSTLIKILAGLTPPTGGTITVDGEEVHFASPRDSLDAGIATVYQDLALVPSLSVWRNFFLGQELTGALGRLREEEMKKITHEQLSSMGIVLGDVSVELSALSGGQRQVVAIARAIYFGARYIILDEPTAALGVKQSGMVLRFIDAARERGMGVVFITHNPQHAYLVGDHFVVLTVGEATVDAAKEDVTLPELTQWMAGGDELEELKQELAR